jgi:hypothetical protein
LKYYLDSSVIVDYIFGDSMAVAIISELNGELFSSRLSRTETIRTITKTHPEFLEDAYVFLGNVNVIEISESVLLRVEGYNSENTLKTSDAIHVASAECLLDEDDYLITFDKQMAKNAKQLGLQVITSS